MKTPAFANPSIQSFWFWNVLNGGRSMRSGSAVATMIERLSAGMVNCPRWKTPFENGVSILRSSVPQNMPASARSTMPRPMVAMTIENCG